MQSVFRNAAIGLAATFASIMATGSDVNPPEQRWNAAVYGNHRYLVSVAKAADAVRVTLPWRRRDAHPESVETIVVGPDGKRVEHVWRQEITQASGTLVFAAAKAGTYAVYYQPYDQDGRSNYPTVKYRKPDEVDAAWQAAVAKRTHIPDAGVVGYEAVDDFDAYTDMERVADPAAMQKLRAGLQANVLQVFPEDRSHVIRMFDAIPQRWAERGPGGTLAMESAPAGFVSAQLGVWAANAPLQDVSVRFGDLTGPSGAVIPAAAWTSFSNGGTDYAGKPFVSRVDVPAGKVQALWVGADLDAGLPAGVYRGTLAVSAAGLPTHDVPVSLTVTGTPAKDHGDDEPANLTRLRWLNSRLAQDDSVTRPLKPVTRRNDKLSILGRDIELDSVGMPARIGSYFDERMTRLDDTSRALLAAPMRLIVEGPGGVRDMKATGRMAFTQPGPGKLQWRTEGRAGDVQQTVDATLEADGTLSYQIALTSPRAVDLSDIRFEVPLKLDAARYMLGLGRTGDTVPKQFDWQWNVEHNQDGLWIGDVNAGLELHLRDEHYSRPLNTNFYHQKPLVMPGSWDNGGKGGIRLRQDSDAYRVVAFSGPRHMQAGETLRYDIVMRVTPFKTIDPVAHFAERFFHKYGPLADIQAQGANVVNIHHATPINPWINYPFLTPDAMRAYVDEAHRRNMRVKIYDTVRELSNRSPELPMLESLGHEVISAGKGGGASWLQEHLDGDYIPAWYVPEIRDAAVINAGQSRWHNYYIEGLDWVARNVGIDGLYLDDVAYDRTTMKRVRKVLDARRPHALIDLHSANQYNPRDGYINSALLYMELFPYIDRLWFGEEFDYEGTSPNYWLTELSGIPYGLMGEMLQHDGNPWRGMVFGMTNRLGWSDGSDPRPLWKAWDAFGIEKAEMIGWWVHDAPVRTGRDDVLATSYVRDGQTMIAIASWAKTPVEVHLSIDWKALGIDGGKATFVAPAIDKFQAGREWRPGDAIEVAPGKGWLIVVK
ncbi:hypothetical protein EC912_101481 [Luteibacter rhizovicinus]|uniref:Glycoside hydrolase 123-like N-terminal domain-containing protein n=1 Tax=Luteibacter rhizovicinus TaxID=242606 RepID=A0A4V2W4W6_9GAMM|nr:glycoside hydrolase domain-containing protein [Luteibacter rhizovicinus]TCV97469.1 hypothetical protein EC912_101481 [Luteibacter rhizovicinus]